MEEGWFWGYFLFFVSLRPGGFGVKRGNFFLDGSGFRDFAFKGFRFLGEGGLGFLV